MVGLGPGINTPARLEYGMQGNKMVGGCEDLQGKSWRSAAEWSSWKKNVQLNE